MEQDLIRRALRKTGGNSTQASPILGISHRTLPYKIKGYGIRDEWREMLPRRPPSRSKLPAARPGADG